MRHNTRLDERLHDHDPALEEMVRRAEAGLPPWYDPAEQERRVGQTRRRPQINVFGSGRMMAFCLLCILVVVGVVLTANFIGQWVSSGATTTQPNTIARGTGGASGIEVAPTIDVAPTSTPPAPTPTQASGSQIDQSSLPLSSSDAISLVRAFYNNQGMWAGTYVIYQIDAISLTPQDSSDIFACVGYEYATISNPDVSAGSDSRTFELRLSSDGANWNVTHMGDYHSC